MNDVTWTVVDLFSGAGGASCGFAAHPQFEVVGSVDLEVGKPSNPIGSLRCNSTYEHNLGVAPLDLDLGAVSGSELRDALEEVYGVGSPTVLIACPPCTGFSRAKRDHHAVDDPRNSLVAKVVEFVEALEPDVLVMENVPEMLQGNFREHWRLLHAGLSRLGWEVRGEVDMLPKFGLPQKRQRALVVGTRPGLTTRSLSEMWYGWKIKEGHTTVRHAIGHLPFVEPGVDNPDDPMHALPTGTDKMRRRLSMIPPDGGSWRDARDHPDVGELFTRRMKQYLADGDETSFPDIYGRMRWDEPAPTIKRECSHPSKGRYAHPEQDRRCTVREMAILQGFPSDYEFIDDSLIKQFAHIGNAVPPLIAHQIAGVCAWILGGEKPKPRELVLPGTSLDPEHIVEDDPFAGALPLVARAFE